MSWIPLVIMDVFADSTVIFIDNYVSDLYFKGRHAVAQKLFYGWAEIILAVALLLIFGIDFSAIDPLGVAIFMVSGLIVSLAGIPYCRTLELDDSTNLGIFIQLAPVLYLILGWFWLGSEFSPIQLVAFAVILAGPLLVVLTTRKRSRKVKLRAMLFAFLYVLLYVVGNMIFVKENAAVGGLNFATEIALFILGRGIGDIGIVYTRPKLRKRMRYVVKASKGKVFRPMVVDFIVYVVATATYRAALVTAPSVAVASAASDSAEPIAIFFLGIIFTLIYPKFGREKMDRKTVMVHLSATVFVVVGIVLMQVVG